MLFKHKHLLKELRKSGRRATAEIISVKTVGEGSSIRALWAPEEDLSSGWIDCVMRLRVIPAQRDEPPFETTAMPRVLPPYPPRRTRAASDDGPNDQRGATDDL